MTITSFSLRAWSTSRISTDSHDESSYLDLYDPYEELPLSGLGQLICRLREVYAAKCEILLLFEIPPFRASSCVSCLPISEILEVVRRTEGGRWPCLT